MFFRYLSKNSVLSSSASLVTIAKLNVDLYTVYKIINKNVCISKLHYRINFQDPTSSGSSFASASQDRRPVMLVLLTVGH